MSCLIYLSIIMPPNLTVCGEDNDCNFTLAGQTGLTNYGRTTIVNVVGDMG